MGHELKWKGDATKAVPVGMMFGPSMNGKYHITTEVCYDAATDLTVAKMKEVK